MRSLILYQQAVENYPRCCSVSKQSAHVAATKPAEGLAAIFSNGNDFKKLAHFRWTDQFLQLIGKRQVMLRVRCRRTSKDIGNTAIDEKVCLRSEAQELQSVVYRRMRNGAEIHVTGDVLQAW